MLATKSIILSILLNLILINSIIAQKDTSNYVLGDLMVNFGIAKINPSPIKSLYLSDKAFQWGVGMKFGRFESPAMPWIEYSRYQLKSDSAYSNLDSVSAAILNTDGDENIARRSQLILGVANLQRISERSFIILKSALTFNSFREDFNRFDTSEFGLLFGIGFKNLISDKISWNIDFRYEYSQSKNDIPNELRDWSTFSLNTGFSYYIAKMK